MKLDNLFQSKWFIRGLALMFAIILFIFVNVEMTSDQNDSSIPGRTTQIETLEDVPVDIRMASDNYVVSGVPEFATVSIEGTPAIVMPTVLNRNFSVFIDLEGLGEGEHTVELEHDLTNDLNVYIEPKTIDIVIEERATQEFLIEVDFLNIEELPTGLEIASYELDNPTVEVTTSRAVMEQIGIIKVYVDVGGLDSSIQNREVPINVYDNQGNELQVRLDRDTAVVSVDIANPSKTVPIEVQTTGESPEGFSVASISANLDEVEIFATSDVLENIESLSTEEIDLSEIEESGTVEVNLMLPEGVITDDLETIEVDIELEETQVIEDVPIETEDSEAEDEDGQDVSFTEPENGSMDLMIIGDEDVVGEFSEEDFTLSINVEDLEPGDHVVDIEMEWDAVDDVSVDGEFTEAAIEIE